MPTRRKPTFARRALARIEDAGEAKAYEIAQYIVNSIHALAPVDRGKRGRDEKGRFNGKVTPRKTRGPHLRDSYYIDVDANGDSIIKCRRRYWAYVEFGTREHGKAQPHVRPSIEAAREIYT